MTQFVNRRDLSFLLNEVLAIDELYSHERFKDYDTETASQVLDATEALAKSHFLELAELTDRHPPQFVNGEAVNRPEVKPALKAYADAGLAAACFDTELGGLQMPYTLWMACIGMLYTANGSTVGYSILTNGAANVIAKCGSEEQKALFLPPMLDGRWFGTMCLSEPQAGSSLSDIRTRAEPREDGMYRITGTKMWISGGDQDISENIVHLVLAKIPGGPPGVKGISLFIVPKFCVEEDGSSGARNNISLAGLNHKMGQRGISNTLLNFGEGGETIGYLVGEPHRGLPQMFHMMNEARILIGCGATMSGLAGYLNSLEYAMTRPQGRKPGVKDPETPQVPIIEHADVKRMLLAQKAWVEGAEALIFYCARLVDELACAEHENKDTETRNRLLLLLELLTPIAKSYPSEFCLEANKLAIQVLGGYGYTTDYPVERFYRDNRLNMIHEGTHGIQALDLLGRKVKMAGGAGLAILAELVNETIAQADNGGFSEEAGQLAGMLENLAAATRASVSCSDTELALANATLFLDGFGHVVVAWLWLKQALVAETCPSDDFYSGKIRTMRYYFRYELPKATHLFQRVADLDDTALAAKPSEFSG